MIELERVSLRYDDGTEALRELDLSLERGSLHFLTGPSGAGKSSLMRLLYLARPPSAGRLRIDGRDATRLSRREIARQRRVMGVVFQDFRLLDHLSVYENVALPLVVAGEREAQFRSDVLEMLEWVMLQDKIALKPTSLSGGEKQRVAIARAMVTSPELILADEPTGSVDPEMGERIMSLFLEMQSLDRTVLIATHDMALVRRIGAPVLRIEDGRLLQTAPATGSSPAEEWSAPRARAFGPAPERIEPEMSEAAIPPFRPAPTPAPTPRINAEQSAETALQPPSSPLVETTPRDAAPAASEPAPAPPQGDDESPGVEAAPNAAPAEEDDAPPAPSEGLADGKGRSCCAEECAAAWVDGADQDEGQDESEGADQDAAQDAAQDADQGADDRADRAVVDAPADALAVARPAGDEPTADLRVERRQEPPASPPPSAPAGHHGASAAAAEGEPR